MHCLLRSVLALTLILYPTPSLLGQAGATATRSFGFKVFGGYSRVNPDYAAKTNGYVVGGETNVHLRWFDPALEFRYGHSDFVVKEDYFLGNIKLERPLGPANRIAPYIDAGLGYGDIRFPSKATDSTIVKSLGAGVDLDLIHHFAARFDYAYQYWSFGAAGPNLNPSLLTGALVYKFSPALFHR